MRDAALERHRVIFGPPRRFAAGGGIAALAMLDHLSHALQHRNLADPGDVTTVPLHAKLEVLVRVETTRVDGELGHGFSLTRSCRGCLSPIEKS